MLASLKIAMAAAGLFVLGGNTGEDAAQWSAQVSHKLERAVAFDADRLAPYQKGVTGLSFRIGDDGKATDISVVSASGNDWIDRRAEGKLRMIGKLPDAPESVRGRTLYAVIVQGDVPQGRAYLVGREVLAHASSHGGGAGDVVTAD
jgi:hypothetical protein